MHTDQLWTNNFEAQPQQVVFLFVSFHGFLPGVRLFPAELSNPSQCSLCTAPSSVGYEVDDPQVPRHQLVMSRLVARGGQSFARSGFPILAEMNQWPASGEGSVAVGAVSYRWTRLCWPDGHIGFVLIAYTTTHTFYLRRQILSSRC